MTTILTPVADLVEAGLLTPDEAKRIREGRQYWQVRQEQKSPFLLSDIHTHLERMNMLAGEHYYYDAILEREAIHHALNTALAPYGLIAMYNYRTVSYSIQVKVKGLQ